MHYQRSSLLVFLLLQDGPTVSHSRIINTSYYIV